MCTPYAINELYYLSLRVQLVLGWTSYGRRVSLTLLAALLRADGLIAVYIVMFVIAVRCTHQTGTKASQRLRILLIIL